jgi:hypothetical protein
VIPAVITVVIPTTPANVPTSPAIVINGGSMKPASKATVTLIGTVNGVTTKTVLKSVTVAANGTANLSTMLSKSLPAGSYKLVVSGTSASGQKFSNVTSFVIPANWLKPVVKPTPKPTPKPSGSTTSTSSTTSTTVASTSTSTPDSVPSTSPTTTVPKAHHGRGFVGTITGVLFGVGAGILVVLIFGWWFIIGRRRNDEEDEVENLLLGKKDDDDEDDKLDKD